MITWWASLSVTMKILWGVTLTASLVFIIQSILTFVGADTGGDFDADLGGLDGGLDAGLDSVDADLDSVSGLGGHTGMNLYTFRNLVNFLLGFGWTAIILKERVHSVPLLIIISLIVGVALVVAVMFLFKWLAGMQQSGTIDLYKSAVGCQGKVYLTIPGRREGEGKVQISINGAVREYSAVTDSDTLSTGTAIKVVEVLSESLVLVEEIQSLII